MALHEARQLGTEVDDPFEKFFEKYIQHRRYVRKTGEESRQYRPTGSYCLGTHQGMLPTRQPHTRWEGSNQEQYRDWTHVAETVSNLQYVESCLVGDVDHQTISAQTASALLHFHR